METCHYLKIALFPKELTLLMTHFLRKNYPFYNFSLFEVWNVIFGTLDWSLKTGVFGWPVLRPVSTCFGSWASLTEVTLLDESPSQTLRNLGPSAAERPSPPDSSCRQSYLPPPPVDTQVHTWLFHRQRGSFPVYEDLRPSEMGVILSILLRFVLEMMTRIHSGGHVINT